MAKSLHMDWMADIVVNSGLEWVYDAVEDRFGRAAAWIVTIMTAVAVIAAVAAVAAVVVAQR